jgi:hypothetical protein
MTPLVLTVQAPGRLLTHDDIRQDLERRMAELYWPDDNLWYLIEIMGVDLLTHKAQVRCRNTWIVVVMLMMMSKVDDDDVVSHGEVLVLVNMR